MKEKIHFIQNLINQGCKISTDSRKVSPGNIFFALQGDYFNGNEYANEALKNGCIYAIVDQDLNLKEEKNIKVNNVLLFLQELAKNHRKQFNIPIIAITGSNGKTTTKELISKTLSAKYNILNTIGNLNNHIGTPLTLLNLNKNHELAVVEIGANQPNEISMLSEIVRPTHGLITNIGKAHLEGFKNLNTVIETKSALYKFLIKNNGTIFQRGENKILTELTKYYRNIITYGSESKNDIQGTLINTSSFLSLQYLLNTDLSINKKGVLSEVKTHLTGKYNYENILAAIAVGLYFDLLEKDINNAISSYKPDNSRSQIIEGKNCIFMDAYNANPTSMLASLESFLTFGKEPKTLILGDMLELGDHAKPEHEKIITWITKHNFQNVILVGNCFYSLKNDYEKYQFFISSNEALGWLEKKEILSNTLLIKGSRGIKLENLLPVLV